MANKSVATVEETKNQLPAYLQDYAGPSGKEALDTTDVVVPRIKLLQATSPELEANPEEARSGNYWHNILEQSLGNSFEFIVSKMRKKYLLFAPRAPGNELSGVLARSEDAKHWDPPNAEFAVRIKGRKEPVIWRTKPTVEESGLHKFGTSNPDDKDSQPAAVLIYEYLVYIPELGHAPALFSAARSQVKVAKNQLNSKIMMSDYPITALKFRAGVVKEEGAEGPYFNYAFKSAGFANQDEFAVASRIAKDFANYAASDETSIVSEVGGGANGNVGNSKVNADVPF
jgi:hypothetical protein